MIAYCGLNCSVCPAFSAYKNNDDELRKKTAAEWSVMYQTKLQPSDINCTGCKSESSVKIGHCAECRIRICASEKGLENCGFCGSYPCSTVSHVVENVVEAKNELEKARSRR